jgi:hypothetical protein
MLLSSRAPQEPPTCVVFVSLTSVHSKGRLRRDGGIRNVDVPAQKLPAGDAVRGEEVKLYHHLADWELHSGCFWEGV